VSHRLLSRVALWSKFSQGLNAATSSCTYSRRPVEEDRNPASYLPRGEFGGGTTRKGGNKLPPNFLPKTARRVRACSLHRCGSRPPTSRGRRARLETLIRRSPNSDLAPRERRAAHSKCRPQSQRLRLLRFGASPAAPVDAQPSGHHDSNQR